MELAFSVIRKTYYIENPSRLSLELRQLVISKEDSEPVTRPLEDASHIIIDNPQITITAPLLQTCIETNTSIVICDNKHLPSGILLPLDAHSMTGGRTRAQINCSKPLHKQLWQQTIRAKIINQARVLKKWNKPYLNLERISQNVRSGDATNTEATAAAFYWKNFITGRKDFRRDALGEPPNSFLNFGYAVLRSLAARSLIGSGLWPVLGMFHRNLYNHLPLADDIMEPYRPFVDDLILEMIEEDPAVLESFMLEKHHRMKLINISFRDALLEDKIKPLQIAMQSTCASLAKCYEDKTAYSILYPEFI